VRLSDAVKQFSIGYFSTCIRSPKTRAAYRLDLHQLQKFAGAAATLETINAGRLEAWARHMRASGYASVSIRRKLATARVFFSYWMRKDQLEHSPFWKLRLDLDTQRVLPRNISAATMKALIEAAWRSAPRRCPASVATSDPRFLRLRDTAVLELLFATGIRVGELVALGLSDWREEERCFLVHGKGSRERLALLPDARSFLGIQRYLDHRCTLPLKHTALFVNAAGERLSTQGVTRVLAETARRAGIVEHVTPHMVRHTVATLLLRYGADLRIVQEVLGHSSISTTQRYTHVSKEHLALALRRGHPNHHLPIAVPASLRRE
jgi:site-specific recombinase XerD